MILLIPMVCSGQTIRMNVSAYTWTGNVMANGEYPHVGAVASDDLPIGTKVRIGGKVYVVKDRFGGGYTNRLDIYMDNHDECIQFGRQYIDVEVMR